MIGGEFPDASAISYVNAISDSQPSWRFGESFCRPSAHYSLLSPSDSRTLEAKLSPAAQARKLEPGIQKFIAIILNFFYDIYILLMTCFVL
jgi:hypothetical protein